MNKVQEKSLELLRLFVQICEKWEIPYFAVCGTALGAAKYGGFIPWDDDIDVGLLRKDYRRFLEVAPRELPDWCFLQNYKTEKLFHHTFSKLRDSRTTFIEANVRKKAINHGIYIDIFPIDGHPAGKLSRTLFRLRQKGYNWIRFAAVEESSNPKVQKRNRILRTLGMHKYSQWAIGRLERMYESFSTETSALWCNYGNWQGKLEYAPKWHYGNGTWATFEGVRIRIPENYDTYLTQKYGVWREDPPEEKQKTHHISVICDPDKPYTEYV